MDVARVLAGLGYVGLLATAGAGIAVSLGAVTVPASVSELTILEPVVRTVRTLPPVGLAVTFVLGLWGLWRLVAP